MSIAATKPRGGFGEFLFALNCVMAIASSVTLVICSQIGQIPSFMFYLTAGFGAISAIGALKNLRLGHA